MEIFDGFDPIADGTDNLATRYLVNHVCVLSGKPNVYAWPITPGFDSSVIPLDARVMFSSTHRTHQRVAGTQWMVMTMLWFNKSTAPDIRARDPRFASA
jgi:hypothetical protein